MWWVESGDMWWARSGGYVVGGVGGYVVGEVRGICGGWSREYVVGEVRGIHVCGGRSQGICGGRSQVSEAMWSQYSTAVTHLSLLFPPPPPPPSPSPPLPPSHPTPTFSHLQALLYSVITYAVFEVTYKKWASKKEDKAAVANSGRVLGYMGLHTLVWFWPFFLILHYSGVEPFEWPPMG